MSLANISIVGNLVRTPEQMHFESGKIKTTLTVAVNGFGKPSRGGDSADFYRVEAWGRLAELAGKYLEKGNQVGVSGRLIFDRFTDQQGKNRMVPVVEANQLSLPPKPKFINEASNEHNEDGANLAAATMSGHLVLDMDNNDVPAATETNTNEDIKVVAIPDTAKAKSKRQAVLSA
jgi:single-strand DNA-binding protein